MKKTAVIISGFIILAALLNMEVTTKQGIDFRVREIRLPLYLKALDYLDRHCNYIQLVRTITSGVKDEDAKVLKILDWVHVNIRQTPRGFPIVDDHPMNIIIRGYGAGDQLEDIFTILCYYAGTRAFYVYIKNSKGSRFPVSFVKLRRGWSPMSAYFGTYIKKEGRLATLKDISDDPSLIAPIAAGIDGFEAEAFFNFINTSDLEAHLLRTASQSPFGRAAYRIKRIFFCGKKTGYK